MATTLVRRTAIVLLGITLSFFLHLFIDYELERHEYYSRLAKQVLLLGLETNMTDRQIAQTIGDDPMRVLRRSVWISYAVELTVMLSVGAVVGCFEKRSPAIMTAFTLMPYVIWCCSVHTSTRNTRLAAVVFLFAKEVGISAVYLALAILLSVAIARSSRKLMSS